jgi:hypothetical protein
LSISAIRFAAGALSDPSVGMSGWMGLTPAFRSVGLLLHR